MFKLITHQHVLLQYGISKQGTLWSCFFDWEILAMLWANLLIDLKYTAPLASVIVSSLLV